MNRKLGKKGPTVSAVGLDVKGNRANLPRYQGENFNKNFELVEKIKTLATEKGCTSSQLAIAWLLA